MWRWHSSSSVVRSKRSNRNSSHGHERIRILVPRVGRTGCLLLGVSPSGRGPRWRGPRWRGPRYTGSRWRAPSASCPAWSLGAGPLGGVVPRRRRLPGPPGAPVRLVPEVRDPRPPPGTGPVLRRSRWKVRRCRAQRPWRRHAVVVLGVRGRGDGAHFRGRRGDATRPPPRALATTRKTVCGSDPRPRRKASSS